MYFLLCSLSVAWHQLSSTYVITGCQIEGSTIEDSAQKPACDPPMHSFDAAFSFGCGQTTVQTSKCNSEHNLTYVDIIFKFMLFNVSMGEIWEVQDRSWKVED